MIRCIKFVFILCSFVGVLEASPKLTGQIAEIYVNDNSRSNIIFLSLNQSFSTPCRETDLAYLVMDLNEPSMKEAYSMALAAFMGNKTVSVAGKGECLGSLEKLQYIYMVK